MEFNSSITITEDLTEPYFEDITFTYENANGRITSVGNYFEDGATLEGVADLFKDFLTAAGFVVDDVAVNHTADGSYFTICVNY